MTIQEKNILPTSITDVATLEEFCDGLGIALSAPQSLLSPQTVLNQLLIDFTLGRRWLSISALLVNCTFFAENLELSMEEEEEKEEELVEKAETLTSPII